MPLERVVEMCCEAPARIFGLINLHRVTHFCVAPTVMNRLAMSRAAEIDNAETAEKRRVYCIVGGAAPASASINRLEKLGIAIS